MATRDLTYLIDFNVEGADDLSTASEKMDDLAEATNGLDEGTHTVDIEVPEDLSTNIDGVGDSLGDLQEPLDTTDTKVGGLRSVLADFGLTSIGVGEAVDLARGALELGKGAWDAIHDASKAAEQATRDFNAATLEVSGAIDTFQQRVEATTDPMDVLAQALTAGFDDEQIASTSAALGDMGLQVEDLGNVVLTFAETGDLTATFYDMATAAGVSTEGLTAFQLGSTNVIGTIGDLTDGQQEFVDGFNTIALSLNGVDFATVAERQLDVVEGFDAIGVAAARAQLGPDASDLEVWLAYTQNLIDAEAAAEGAADAVEDVAATPVTVDTAEAQENVEDLKSTLEEAATPRTAEVTAEAETEDATDELDALPQSERVALIQADADTAAAAEALLNETDRPRTAYIIADALVGLAEGELDDLVNAERTAIVDVATGSVDLPSYSAILSKITGGAGRITVPIVGVWASRIEGSRPR